MDQNYAGLTCAEKRKARARERGQAFRAKKNAEYLQSRTSYLDAKFAAIALPGAQIVEDSFFAYSTRSYSCDEPTSVDFVDRKVFAPIPLPTDPLQLISEEFYDCMATEVEDIETICAKEQLHRVVQLKLASKICPERVTRTITYNAAITQSFSNFTLPQALEEVIDNLASEFSVPVGAMPIGYRPNPRSDVDVVTFKPTLNYSVTGTPSYINRSRFLTIFDAVRGVPCSTYFSDADWGVSGELWFQSDALAVSKILTKIPVHADSAWKLPDSDWHTEAKTSYNAKYLLFGPCAWACSSPKCHNIKQPPPITSRTLLRLTAEDGAEPNRWYYGLYSNQLRDEEYFHSRFRRMLQQRAVQNAFSSLDEIEMNTAGTLKLQY